MTINENRSVTKHPRTSGCPNRSPSRISNTDVGTPPPHPMPTVRSVAVGIGVEDRLDLPLQPRGHHCLRDPIGHSRHTQNSDPVTMRLRYLHGQHRRRKVTAPKTFDSRSCTDCSSDPSRTPPATPVHPGAPLIGLNLLPGLPPPTSKSQTTCLTISARPSRLLPEPQARLIERTQPQMT